MSVCVPVPVLTRLIVPLPPALSRRYAAERVVAGVVDRQRAAADAGFGFGVLDEADAGDARQGHGMAIELKMAVVVAVEAGEGQQA